MIYYTSSLVFLWLVLSVLMFLLDKKDIFFYKNRVLVTNKKKAVKNVIEVEDLDKPKGDIIK